MDKLPTWSTEADEIIIMPDPSGRAVILKAVQMNSDAADELVKFHNQDIASLQERIRVLEEAIKDHRSQKADDRCIEDDDRLYEALGDGIKCDRRVGSKEEMLRNCERFIDRRCQQGHWPTYQQLEQELEALKNQADCPYCGEKMPRFAHIEERLPLRAHIDACEVGPVVQLIAQRDEADKNAVRLFPMMSHQSVTGPPIPWATAEWIYRMYSRLYGDDQSLDRMAERGGFGWQEIGVIMNEYQTRFRRFPTWDPRSMDRKS